MPSQTSATPSDGPPWTVGWKEFVEFPDWGLGRVKAKMDTGARTTALDVSSYELREVPGGGLVAELRLAPDRKDPAQVAVLQVPVLRVVAVSNSSGMREQRPLVETTIRLGPVAKAVRLTVTNRAGMRFPLILGRKALEGDFVVDVGRKYVWGRRTRRRRPGRA